MRIDLSFETADIQSTMLQASLQEPKIEGSFVCDVDHALPEIRLLLAAEL
jgi:hypothetical protein